MKKCFQCNGFGFVKLKAIMINCTNGHSILEKCYDCQNKKINYITCYICSVNGKIKD